MIKKTFERNLHELKSSLSQKRALQDTLYYLRKDNNVKELLAQVIKYSQVDIRDEACRTEIIMTGFKNNIIFMNELLSFLCMYTYNDNSFLCKLDAETIAKPCMTFPDDIGKDYIKLLAFSPVILLFKELLEKYSNNNIRETEISKFEEIYSNIKALAPSLIDEKLKLEFGIMYISSLKDQTRKKTEDFKEQFGGIIKKLSKSFDSKTINYDVETIKSEILGIKTKFESERDNFLDDKVLIGNILSSKYSFRAIKDLLSEKEDNHFIYMHFSEVTMIILKNQKKSDEDLING